MKLCHFTCPEKPTQGNVGSPGVDLGEIPPSNDLSLIWLVREVVLLFPRFLEKKCKAGAAPRP